MQDSFGDSLLCLVVLTMIFRIDTTDMGLEQLLKQIFGLQSSSRLSHEWDVTKSTLRAGRLHFVPALSFSLSQDAFLTHKQVPWHKT